jgi:hypothetical protein
MVRRIIYLHHMSYLLYVALLGLAVVIFLWLRDLRIFYRTGLPGYRKAAYHGVLFGAVGTSGFLLALYMPTMEVAGIGIVLAALYLQGRDKREKVWKNEGTVARLLGSVPLGKR